MDLYRAGHSFPLANPIQPTLLETSQSAHLYRAKSLDTVPGAEVVFGPEHRAFLRSRSLPLHADDTSTLFASTKRRKPQFKIELPPSVLPGCYDPSRVVRDEDNKNCAISQNRPNPVFTDYNSFSSILPLLTPPEDASPVEFKPSTSDSTRVSPYEGPSSAETYPSSASPVVVEPAVETMSLPNITQNAHDIIHNQETSTQPVDAILPVAVNARILKDGPVTKMTMVYQALPYPLPYPLQNDAFATATIFPGLIDSLQRHTHIRALSIQVTKVHPENSPLESYPQSPPVTPSGLSRLAQQSDYFASVSRPVIFNASFSTGFAVLPSSVEFALLERIIPPSSRAETRTLFDPSSDSALVTRVNELAPNGILILIYPTVEGAETFFTKYLSPLLDPVLTAVVEEHGLAWSLAKDLLPMESIRGLPRFAGMKDNVEELVKGLSKSTHGMPNTTFSLVHSSRCAVQVPRKAWAKWWIYQERPRIKNYLIEYYRRGMNIPKGNDITEDRICREIMESFERQKYEVGEEPGEEDGIEVGAFVIKRDA